MKLRLASQARADLDAIWLFLAQQAASSTPADKVLAALMERFQQLLRFPALGKSFEIALLPGIRCLTAGQYLIFYIAHPDRLHILRIIHARRDAYAVFTEELICEE